MIRAAMLDLDGTLIGRDETVSPRVAQAVSKVREKVPVTIASGREVDHVVRFARHLGLSTPQISDGGAVILDPLSGRCLWTAPLPPGPAQEIVKALHASGTAFIATYPGGSTQSFEAVDGQNIVRVSAVDLDEVGADGLMVQFQPNRDLYAVKVFLPYNDLWAVDITSSGVDKASAALSLAGMIGVDVSHTVAVGDSFNDLTLLRLCGLSIAMGDAPQDLKDVADYVAPAVEEDGLAVAIEEFILPRL